MRFAWVFVGCSALVAFGCSASDAQPSDGGIEAGPADDGAVVDVASPGEGGSDAAACTTHVEYGSHWIAPANHPNDFDTLAGTVTWDGSCADAGSHALATLSDGTKVEFDARGSCALALDPSCGPKACSTRVAYGNGWKRPPNHPADFDDFSGRVFGDGSCTSGTAKLSNGDVVAFSGTTCPIAFGWTGCGGLYTNSILPKGCADPGVMRDVDGTYVVACTSGGAANAFPIYTSPDLVHWKAAGHVFPSGKHPAWTTGAAFWAPEIHRVNGKYVVYFSAEYGKTGNNAVGAASAPAATGPFTDVGAPLVVDATIGVIDASEITTSANESYLLWKTAGLGVGKPTPIHSQKLTTSGLALTGSPVTLITNDQPWEGKSTEGPFMVEHGGMFYLFYSGGIYSNASYAVGVARAPTPHEPMTKLPNPILVTNDDWVGPGHNAIVETAAGNTAIVYHAWKPGCVAQQGCDRWLMMDPIAWNPTTQWPRVVMGPSANTRPRF